MDYKYPRLSLIQLYFTSKKMPCTLQRVKKHLLLNIVLYSSENKTQNCFPFFKNHKTKGNAAQRELSRYSHTAILSSVGDWLFVQSDQSLSSVQFSRSVVSDSLRPHDSHSVTSNSLPRHGLQHASLSFTFS